MHSTTPELEQIMADIAADCLSSFIAAAAMPLDPSTDAFYRFDPDLSGASRASLLPVVHHPRFAEAVRVLSDDAELSVFAPREGQLDPMLIHAGGGSRLSSRTVLSSVVQTAFTELCFRDLPREKSTFAAMVVRNLRQLRQAVRGEPVTMQLAIGFTGARLWAGRRLQTPWGELLNIPEDSRALPFARGRAGAQTSMFLIVEYSEEVSIDRRPEPPIYPVNADVLARRDRATLLLPLAFAFAQDTEPRAVPRVSRA